MYRSMPAQIEDTYHAARILIYNFSDSDTVETLYNVTPYNRIFNIRHKIAGNGSVSIKIPSL